MERRAYFLLAVSVLLNLLVLCYVANVTSILSASMDRMVGSTSSGTESASVSLNEGSLLQIQRLIDNSLQTRTTPPNLLRHHEVNNAPLLPVIAGACKNGKLFGKEHQGGNMDVHSRNMHLVNYFVMCVGWLACDDETLRDHASKKKCVVYSFGLGFDWSFDSDLERLGCEIHGFDPSGKNWRDGMYGTAFSNVDYAKQYPSQGKHFHNWGLGAADTAIYPPGTIPQDWPGLGDPQFSSSNSEPWQTKSLAQSMKELGHYSDKSSITILKIDIEGAEWDALIAFFGDTQTVAMIKNGFIQQFLVEWHWDPDSRY